MLVARLTSLAASTAVAALAALTMAVSACSASHGTSAEGDGAVGDGSIIDGGRRDGSVRMDAGSCLLDCAPPPSGCHYEGEVQCDPPRCPDLVCVDAAVICVPCLPPDPGCHYEGAEDCSTCGTMVCDDPAGMCGPGEPFPIFGERCATVEDCAIAIHQTDCCGNTYAFGIERTEQAAFDRAERSCRGTYPACGCASGPTVTESGLPAYDPSAISVYCSDESRCDTTAPLGP